jgi:hypothetical protein
MNHPENQAMPMPWLTSRGIWGMCAASLAGALLLLNIARTIIHHQPVYDELVHVLAARGLLLTGQPVIAGGTYDRAVLFTHLVAKCIQWQGDSLEDTGATVRPRACWIDRCLGNAQTRISGRRLCRPIAGFVSGFG